MTNESRDTPRVALYARVSSEGQERDETVQSQLEALRVYADAKGYDKPAEFVDEARSGYTLVRPALDRLRDAVASGAFDVVLVHEIGRLARDYADQALLLREIRKRARVEFVKHPTDDSPEGQLLENMLGAIANFEGRVIADRTRRGRQHWVERGALVGGGVPYGYRTVPRTAEHRSSMEIDPVQADVVREIFRLFAVEGLTCRAVCKRLTATGIPTPRAGARWHPSTLQRMLTNTAYVGRFMYGRNEAVEPQHPSKAERPNRKSSRRPLPPEHWVTIPCPTIVDEAVFQQAQARLAANAQFSPRNNTRHPYLLRGLVRCGRCGGAYTGNTRRTAGGRERRHYRCNSRDPYKMGARPTCTGFGYLDAELAERTVWETCLDLLQPEVLATEYRRRTLQDEQGGEDAALGKIRTDLKAVERQERRWQDAYASEAIDLPTLKERMDGCRAQRQALEARMASLGQAQERRAHEARVLASLEAFSRSVGQGLETADFAKRQEVIRLMVERVVVEDGGRLRIELAIPLGGPDGGSNGGGQRDPQLPGGSGLGELRPNRLDRGVHPAAPMDQAKAAASQSGRALASAAAAHGSSAAAGAGAAGKGRDVVGHLRGRHRRATARMASGDGSAGGSRVERQISPLGVRQSQWMDDRMAAARRLAEALVRRGAQRIILFGSLAAGDHSVGSDSDVDLVVIMPGIENIRFHRRLADAEEVQRFPYPLDLAVYSPGEWKEIQERGFVRNEVLGRGVILH